MWKSIKIDNIDINYYFEDTGKPKVLLIHGFNSEADGFKSIFNNEYFDVITFDMPGHGESQDVEKFSVSLFQKITRTIIQKLELDNLVVVGHSLGALSALHVSAMNEVKKTILLNPYNPFILRNIPSIVKKNVIDSEQELAEIGKRLQKGNQTLPKKQKELLAKQVMNPLFVLTDAKNIYKENKDNNVSILACMDDLLVVMDSVIDTSHNYDLEITWMEKGGHSPQTSLPNELVEKINEIIKK